MANEHFAESAKACIANGRHLLEDAEFLEYSEPPSTTFALAVIAQEEFAKSFLLVLVAREVIPWNPFIYRAARDHTCKQLLGIVMDYVNPYPDVFLKRIREWNTRNNELGSFCRETPEKGDFRGCPVQAAGLLLSRRWVAGVESGWRAGVNRNPRMNKRHCGIES